MRSFDASCWIRVCCQRRLALATQATAQESPEYTPLDDNERAELMDGEVLRDVDRGDDLIRGEVIGLIEAPLDELASIVSDLENVTEWAPSIEEYEVVGRDGEYYIVDGVTNLPWPIADRTWQMRSRFAYEDVDGHNAFVYTFDYVPGSGNLDDSFGYWLLLEYPEDPRFTYVKYVVNADPGIAIPDAIIRWATRNALPDLIEGLDERHDDVY